MRAVSVSGRQWNIPPHILLHVQAFGSFGGPGRQPGKPHRKAYDN